MEDRYSQKVDMLGNVHGVLANPAYTTALAHIPVLPARVANFDARLGVLAGLLAKLGLSRKGITLNKDNLTAALITEVVAVAKAGATYAYDRGDVALEASLDVEKTHFVEITDDLIDDRAAAIRAAIVPAVTAGSAQPLTATPEPIQAYGITQARLDALQALIIAYGAAVSSPRNAQITAKVALASAEQQIDAILEYLGKVIDRLLVQLKDDPSGLYPAYTSARKLLTRSSGGEEEASGSGEEPAAGSSPTK